MLIDEEGLELNAAGIGELCVHSSTMMTGYWGQHELTKEKMLVISSAESPRQYYRTGDLVERDGAGRLFFVGRKDRQVKIRGFRVELDEIELILRAIPFVEESASICRDH